MSNYRTAVTRLPESGKILAKKLPFSGNLLPTFNKYEHVRTTMPKGLKSTSSQIAISFTVSETAAGAVTQERIDLQLNALDSEVFVVTGVKLDTDFPDHNLGLVGIDPVSNLSNERVVKALVSKQDISSSLDRSLGNPSVFATSTKEIFLSLFEDDKGTIQTFNTMFSEDAIDTPFQMEYIDVIATPDFFVTIECKNNQNAKTVSGKMYGYRAKADSATYAALVQSELLSA